MGVVTFPDDRKGALCSELPAEPSGCTCSNAGAQTAELCRSYSWAAGALGTVHHCSAWAEHTQRCSVGDCPLLAAALLLLLIFMVLLSLLGFVL